MIREDRGRAAAIAGGLAGLLAMACVDFPLQIPATALTATVLLFLAAARGGGEEAVEGPGRLRLRIGALLLAVLALGLHHGAQFLRARSMPGRITAGEVLTEEGRRALEEGRIGEAEELLQRARARQPFEGGTRFYLALALYRRGGYGNEDAAAELAAAFRVARGRADLLASIGILAIRFGSDLYLDAFREASALHPDHFSRARVVLAKFRREEEFPRIVPDRYWSLPPLAEWHLQRGEIEAAIEVWWRAREAGVSRAENALARLYLEHDREAEGRERFAAEGAEWPR
jgi:tetratricopeptide (TPR) repeat protein